MTTLKKIIFTAISVVLLISCFLFTSKSSGLVAGADLDTNERIESVEDLEELVSSFSGKPQDSFTMTVSSKYYSSKDSGPSSESNSMTREMTVYYTEDSILYDVNGIINKKNRYKDLIDEEPVAVTSNTVFSFDLQLLISEDAAFVNFKNYSYAYNLTGPGSYGEIYESKNMQLKSKNTNKWIEIPENVLLNNTLLSEAVEVDFFSSMSYVLELIVEAEYADDNETIIYLDANDLLDMEEDLGMTPSFDLENTACDFKIDLSSPSTPHIYFMYDYSDSRKVSDDTRISTDISFTHDVSISNIDNTVVDFDDDVVEKTVEDDNDFKKLFLIEERRDDE